MPRGSAAILLLAFGAACRQPGSSAAPPPRTQNERMAWWREARFGMFLHWGLYAIPAGEWPMGDPGARHDHGEWIRETARIPLAEYETLQACFDPVRFDADLWARAAAAAGMRYVVITSKHHDGFCLFDSAHTGWDMGGTPSRRDVLGELAAACRRHGLRFGTYHSIMDWHHPDYLPRRGWEAADRPADGADFDRFERYLHAQVEEIVRRYRPAVMWFDGEWEPTWSHERGTRLFELCRSLDPWMIVNNRVDVHRGGMGGFTSSDEGLGDFATPEQEIPPTGVPGVDWETCMTMNDHWGVCAADDHWKSAGDLVRKLVDIASKGGNFLLNVGPRADGTFPPEAVERLAAVGAWMRPNGESVHGTTASPFDALAFGRCTVREGGGRTRLYLHVFERPADGRLVLPGLASDPVRVARLARPDRELPWSRAGSDVTVAMPAADLDPFDTVVVVEVEGPPVVHRAPAILSGSDVFVRPIEVRIEGGSPSLEVRYTLDGTDPVASSPRAEGPITLAETATVRARAFDGDRAVSPVAEASFRRVAGRPATVVPGSLPGLRCDRYTGEWERLPDFRSLTSTGGWTAEAVALPPSWRQERVALRFTGFLEVPREDVYRFELASDDGSRLWIDGELVVDDDGLHATEARTGRIALAAGAHAVEVGWFNRTGGAELSLRSAPLDAPLAPTGSFRRAPDEAPR